MTRHFFSYLACSKYINAEEPRPVIPSANSTFYEKKTEVKSLALEYLFYVQPLKKMALKKPLHVSVPRKDLAPAHSLEYQAGARDEAKGVRSYFFIIWCPCGDVAHMFGKN